MGNYSTPGEHYPGSTFDPGKNYIGVRLQQGVPLIDSDWNELNDVLRYSTYLGFESILNDGVMLDEVTFTYRSQPQTKPHFSVFPIFRSGSNPIDDIVIAPGRAIIQGRPVSSIKTGRIEYSQQPWGNLARATSDGVPVIPRIELPATGARTDLVYLDVWEREIDSRPESEGGDPAIVNPRVGIETCVRLKQEIAVRILSNRTNFPTHEEVRRELGVGNNHFFLPLALITLEAGARISSSRIEDIRPLLCGFRGTHTVSLTPGFLPVVALNSEFSWQLVSDFDITSPKIKVYASKPRTVVIASGILPVTLPDRVRILNIKFRGFTEGPLEFKFTRNPHRYASDNSVRLDADSLVSSWFTPPTGSSRRNFSSDVLPINNSQNRDIVDNNQYYYLITASATGDFNAEIHGISIDYTTNV